ncbi:protein DMP7-like [Silene latifolia]|uniref:protein DMP7-like n=1 Tax=Silene latifolia TaxID=37657 RepID=UPI003D781479
MEIKVEDQISQEIDEEQRQPLLDNNETIPKNQSKTRTQKAIRKTFKGTTRLSSRLPTGSVLIFEMFSPIVTNQGQCQTFQAQLTTLCLIIFTSITCFLMCFTDSVRDERGKVRYGIATFKGLWIVDGSMTLSPNEAAKYRIRVVDFLHGIMGVLVFMAVALLDQNVVKCLFPMPSKETKERLVMFPIGVGIVCSLLFVCFPTKRNGVTSPLSKN